MCEHDNWAHGIRPLFAGTPLECPYRTTEKRRSMREGVGPVSFKRPTLDQRITHVVRNET
jgi:hypothetical protein